MLSIRRHALPLLLAASAACSEQKSPPARDLRAPADLAVGDPADLAVAVPADLARPPDLSPPPDLFLPDLRPATLDPKPTCPDATVTADMLYPLAVARCGDNISCHVGDGDGARLNVGLSGAEMRDALLLDGRVAKMKRVTPGDVDNSLLTYLLMGQQAKVSRSSVQMPPAALLGNEELCQFYNWVRSGAN